MKKFVIILSACLLLIIGYYFFCNFYYNNKIQKYKTNEFILGGQDPVYILNKSKNEIERIYLVSPSKITFKKINQSVSSPENSTV